MKISSKENIDFSVALNYLNEAENIAYDHIINLLVDFGLDSKLDLKINSKSELLKKINMWVDLTTVNFLVSQGNSRLSQLIMKYKTETNKEYSNEYGISPAQLMKNYLEYEKIYSTTTYKNRDFNTGPFLDFYVHLLGGQVSDYLNLGLESSIVIDIEFNRIISNLENITEILTNTYNVTYSDH